MTIEHYGISITVDSIKTKLQYKESEGHDDSEVGGVFVIRTNTKGKRNMNLLTVELVSVTLFPRSPMSTSWLHVIDVKRQDIVEISIPRTKTFGIFNKEQWYIDLGVHLTTNDSSVMNAFYEQNKEIMVANMEKLSVLFTAIQWKGKVDSNITLD